MGVRGNKKQEHTISIVGQIAPFSLRRKHVTTIHVSHAQHCTQCLNQESGSSLRQAWNTKNVNVEVATYMLHRPSPDVMTKHMPEQVPRLVHHNARIESQAIASSESQYPKMRHMWLNPTATISNDEISTFEGARYIFHPVKTQQSYMCQLMQHHSLKLWLVMLRMC